MKKIRPIEPASPLRGGDTALESRLSDHPSISDNLGELLDNIFEKDNVKFKPNTFLNRLESELSRYTGLSPENILIFSEPDAALQSIVDLYIDGETCAVIPGPTEATAAKMVELRGGSVREVYGESPFIIDLDGITEALNRNTALLVLSNPTRPAGTIYSRVELETLLNHRRDFLTVIDEYEFETTGINCTDLIGKFKNLAIIRKFPRLLGLASTAGEYLLADRETISRVRAFREISNYPALSGTAAIAALRSLGYVNRDNQAAKENMILMDTRLRALGFECQKTPFDYVLMKFFDPVAASAYLIARGVSCRSLSGYRQLEDYLALDISNDRNIAAALEACEKFPKRLKYPVEKPSEYSEV